MEHPSATSLNEDCLVAWLFGSHTAFLPIIRQTLNQLWQALALPPRCRVRYGLRDPFVLDRESDPDIDVLVWDPDSPNLATAIECKRIKVTADAFRTGLPGKMTQLQKGAHQTKRLLKLGFSRVFLLPIIVTDGRERTQYNAFFRGPVPELINTIHGYPALRDVPSEVGIGFVHMVQILDKPIDHAAQIFVHTSRPAAPQGQAKRITDGVVALGLEGTHHDLAF